MSAEPKDRYLVCMDCRVWQLMRRNKRGGSSLRCNECGRRAHLIKGERFDELLMTVCNQPAGAPTP